MDFYSNFSKLSKTTLILLLICLVLAALNIGAIANGSTGNYLSLLSNILLMVVFGSQLWTGRKNSADNDKANP